MSFEAIPLQRGIDFPSARWLSVLTKPRSSGLFSPLGGTLSCANHPRPRLRRSRRARTVNLAKDPSQLRLRRSSQTKPEDPEVQELRILCRDRQRVSCKDKYLVPIKAFSKLIRGKFAARLRRSDPDLYRQVDPKIWSKDCGVHSLHHDRGELVVLNYLARCVFRIALTNHRILGMDQSHLTFRYKDRKGGRWKTSRIESHEFLRRYLQHILPTGFHKLRCCGIWHPSHAHHVRTSRGALTLAASCQADPCRQEKSRIRILLEPHSDVALG